MASVLRLLFIVLVIAADVCADTPLTLSPDADFLITTRVHPTSSDTVIDSGLEQSEVTEVSPNNAPPAPVPAKEPDRDVKQPEQNNQKPKATEVSPPSAPIPAKEPGRDAEQNSQKSSTTNSEQGSDHNTKDTMPSAAKPSAPQSSIESVDMLSDGKSKLSAGGSSGVETALPIVFGTLACVGVVVIAVSYKKKRDAAENDSSCCDSDCDFSDTGSTPENRNGGMVQEKPLAVAVAVADFTGTNSSVSSTSPFSSARCKTRVSSPVPSFCSNSQTNMEFQATWSHCEEGNDTAFALDEAQATSLHVVPCK